MDAAEWDQLEALVEHVLALPPQEREAFLEHACAANVALRAEVESLLSFSDEASAYFRRLAEEAVAPPLAALVGEPSGKEQSRRQPLIGQRVSHYQIVEKLGGGGMGVVYRARDLRLERTVALKFLPPHLSADEEAKRRFIAEARAASTLDHVNVGHIYEIDEVEDGRLFIAMACYEGETLQEKLGRGPLPVDEALDYAMQVAQGLQRAHEAGIIHRDIKPGNVMVTGEGVVKLLDFGLAKRTDGSLTQEGAILGTVAYMSPEQAQGRAVDLRTDLWSLGVVLYEMLTGARPFRGGHEQAVIYAIRHDEPEPVAALRPDVPEALERVVARTLKKDPAARYQNARELLADLRALRKAPFSSTARETPRRSRLGVFLRGGLAAVLFVVLLGIGLYTLQTQHEQGIDGSALASPVTERVMVAVLPFDNLGPPDEAYFAAGISEEITSRLASVSTLGVIARSSARQYAGTDKPLRQIGQELGVDYVLEGAVRWAPESDGPDRVRITPHLSRVSDGTTLWSQTYEREMADVFAIQAEIAEAVAVRLGVQLGEMERKAVEDRPTDNLEAYHAYLQGQYYHSRRLDFYSAENWDQAVAHFERAVSLDPTFVLAYVGLVRAHAVLVNHGYDTSDERRRMARAAMERAIELAPDAPEVWLARGEYHYFVELDYDQALTALETAEAGLPENPQVLKVMGFLLRRLGRWDEALERFHGILRLYPDDIRAAHFLGETYHLTHRYREAAQYIDLTIALAPDEHSGYRDKARLYRASTGDLTAARAALESVPATRSMHPEVIRAWVWQELYEGHYATALRRLQSMDGGSKISSLPDLLPGLLPDLLLEALIYDLAGDPERARQVYETSRIALEKELATHPVDEIRYPVLRSRLGIAYAGLGWRDDAIREGEAAAAVRPLAIDGLVAPQRLQDLALIYTMVGEQDAALDVIETLLSMPSWLSVPLLQLDPRWAPLHSHPRFQALLKKTGLE